MLQSKIRIDFAFSTVERYSWSLYVLQCMSRRFSICCSRRIPIDFAFVAVYEPTCRLVIERLGNARDGEGLGLHPSSSVISRCVTVEISPTLDVDV